MFGSTMQFKTSYELLLREIEELLKHKQILESEVCATQTMTVFDMEGNALIYV